MITYLLWHGDVRGWVGVGHSTLIFVSLGLCTVLKQQDTQLKN